MNVISWVMFGGIVGTLANIIDPASSRGGLLGAVVLGVLGAVLGGLISGIVFGISVSGFSLQSLVIAILGSLLLLFLQRAFVIEQ